MCIRDRNQTRPFAQQNRAIHAFIIDAVDLVLTRLDSPDEQGLDLNVGELHSQLLSLLEPLAGRHELNVESIAHQFSEHALVEIVASARRDFARYPEQDPALSNVEEVFYASNGFWATVAHRVAHALRQLGVPVICLLYTSPSPRD